MFCSNDIFPMIRNLCQSKVIVCRQSPLYLCVTCETTSHLQCQLKNFDDKNVSARVYLQISGIWRHQALYRFKTRRRASSLSTDKTGRTCCKMRFDAIIYRPNAIPQFGVLWSLFYPVCQIK